MQEAVWAKDGDFAHPNLSSIHPPKEREDPLCTERLWDGAGGAPGQKHLLAGPEPMLGGNGANSTC